MHSLVQDSILKVALQILGRKIYKNIKKNSSLYFQSLLFFIHKTPVVESYPTTREIRELLRPRSTPTANTVYFYLNSSLIYSLKIKYTGEALNRVSNEDSMENNYMVVMLWNLSVISHWIFPQFLF